MDGEKISVIVPAYNVAPYIEKTLESICAQTYKNLEIIVVDDGSTDETKQAIERAKEKDFRIKAIYKENEGVTKTRLRGVQEASGEWIGFVDADDYVTPEMYEKLLSLAHEHFADIAHCGYKMGGLIKEFYRYGTGRLVVQNEAAGVKDLLLGDYIEPSLCNKLYRKEIFNGVFEKIDFSVKITEDFLMNFYLFDNAKKSVFLDECMYHYLLRLGSTARGALNHDKLTDPLKVLKIVRKEVEGRSELEYIVNERILTNLVKIATLKSKEQNAFLKPYRKAARKELKKEFRNSKKFAFSKKLKLMIVLSIYAPGLYHLVQWVYRKRNPIN